MIASSHIGPGIPPTARRTDIACTPDDAELFYPHRYTDDSTRQARALCRQCPAHAGCLAWALEHETDGVWADTSPDQRRAIKAARTARNRQAGAAA